MSQDTNQKPQKKKRRKLDIWNKLAIGVLSIFLVGCISVFFILVNIIFTFVLGLLDKMLGWQRAGGEGILTTIYGILVFLPWWAVQFRRLHDTDRSAWWALLFLIPFIGWLIIIVFNCQAGTPGENRFGPDPKLEP